MDQAKARLIEEIINNFQKTARLMRFEPEVWLELNLTIVQLKSLFFIDSEGSTNFKSLADALSVTPPSVTGIIDRLVAQGLVSREENPENRRMQILKTTDKAKNLLTKLNESRRSSISTMFERLSMRDLTDLMRISNSLSDREKESI